MKHWMLFLKIFADKEDEAEVMNDDYKSPLEDNYRWQNWAKDDEGCMESIRQSCLMNILNL